MLVLFNNSLALISMCPCATWLSLGCHVGACDRVGVTIDRRTGLHTHAHTQLHIQSHACMHARTHTHTHKYFSAWCRCVTCVWLVGVVCRICVVHTCMSVVRTHVCACVCVGVTNMEHPLVDMSSNVGL